MKIIENIKLINFLNIYESYIYNYIFIFYNNFFVLKLLFCWISPYNIFYFIFSI